MTSSHLTLSNVQREPIPVSRLASPFLCRCVFVPVCACLCRSAEGSTAEQDRILSKSSCHVRSKRTIDLVEGENYWYLGSTFNDPSVPSASYLRVVLGGPRWKAANALTALGSSTSATWYFASTRAVYHWGLFRGRLRASVRMMGNES